MVNLGDMYLNGTGVDRDNREARFWYKRAARRGDPVGQIRLGRLYEEGLGVDPNPVAAHAWYSLAAESGNPDAARERDRLSASLDRTELRQSAELIREERIPE
jgi:TPR repeat protein